MSTDINVENFRMWLESFPKKATVGYSVNWGEEDKGVEHHNVLANFLYYTYYSNKYRTLTTTFIPIHYDIWGFSLIRQVTDRIFAVDQYKWIESFLALLAKEYPNTFDVNVVDGNPQFTIIPATVTAEECLFLLDSFHFESKPTIMRITYTFRGYLQQSIHEWYDENVGHTYFGDFIIIDEYGNVKDVLRAATLEIMDRTSTSMSGAPFYE